MQTWQICPHLVCRRAQLVHIIHNVHSVMRVFVPLHLVVDLRPVMSFSLSSPAVTSVIYLDFFHISIFFFLHIQLPAIPLLFFSLLLNIYFPVYCQACGCWRGDKGEMVFCYVFAPECGVVLLFIRCETEIESFSARPTAVSDDTVEGKDTPHFI